MTAQELIAKALAKRERWVDLGDGKRICMRRPPELELGDLIESFRERDKSGVEKAAALAVAWEGFMLADAIGEGDEPVSFDADLWRVLMADNTEWATKAANAVLEMLAEHSQRREDAAKN